jgi:hypothetical protein
LTSDRPCLRDYELLLQLGHTSDYHAYLARRTGREALYTLRQARKPCELVDTSALETTLRAVRDKPHSNLPQVAEFGIEDGHLFWVSDYVEGETLDALGGRTLQVPTDVAVRLALDVAAALERVSELGGAGPVLRSDVHVGVDGVARVVPPMRWTEGLRREQQVLAESLRNTPAIITHVCAFLWESLAGLALAACREAQGWPAISTLGVSVSPALDALLSDVLHERAHFGRASTLGKVIADSAGGVASRDDVRNWLLGFIRARLEGRSRLLRSPAPIKPSGEIPLVRVPVDLDAVRFGVAAGDTERPLSMPTIPTPQPLPRTSDEPGATGRADESGVPNGISSAPPSSVRSSANAPDVTRRAPLESALAEYAERASRPGQRSSK